MEPSKKKTVLIVEDDQNLQKILTNKLSTEGLSTISADTSQKALNDIKKLKPDLILLDIMLPGGMNGFDVLERLKHNPVLKTIPVIVLTNLSTEEKTAMEIGAIDYVVKANISLDEVALKVKNHLQ